MGTASITHSATLSYQGMAREGVDGIDGLEGGGMIAVSPDGTNVYVTGQSDDAIVGFSRDAQTGAHAYLGALFDKVGGVGGIDGARAIAIDSRGNHVYVAGTVDDAIAFFSRDAATGGLTFEEAYFNSAPTIFGMDNPVSMAMSPDGERLFVTAQNDDSLVVFLRDDRSGELSFQRAYYDANAGIDGLEGANSVAVAPDNSKIYVTGYWDNSLAVFSEDSKTKGLVQQQLFIDGNNGVDGLFTPTSVVVSPDGENVYTTGYKEISLPGYGTLLTVGTVAVFGKNLDGSLRFNTFHQFNFAYQMRHIAVSPDGLQVYAVGTTVSEWEAGADQVGTLWIFNRDSETGALTLVEKRDEIVNKFGILGDDALSVAISPDNQHVYSSVGGADCLLSGELFVAVSMFRKEYLQSDLEAAVNSAIAAERERWDVNNDNQLGLEEAVQALRTVSGN